MKNIVRKFKIGEYAIGGIVKVSIHDDYFKIEALDWKTKERIKKQVFTEYRKGQVMEYLESEITTYFHAERIAIWISQNIDENF